MSIGSWWSRRWDALILEMGFRAPDARAARSYRVKSLEVVPGGIEASIQDRERGACTLQVRVTTLRDDQWERVSELLSTQPLIATQLLSGAMPPDIEQLFAEAGARLLPSGRGDFAFSCSCCQPGKCSHLPLVFGLFGEMLSDDPGLLFLLRGRDRQQILREVRESRGGSAAEPGTDAARATLATGEDDAGLAASLDQYWGNRRLLKQFHHHIAPPAVEISLLRRLGPLNSGDDAMALYEQFVSLYRKITEEALALAYAPDDLPADENRNGG
jgi:uncharacterized Zn finger protein